MHIFMNEDGSTKTEVIKITTDVTYLCHSFRPETHASKVDILNSKCLACTTHNAGNFLSVMTGPSAPSSFPMF